MQQVFARKEALYAETAEAYNIYAYLCRINLWFVPR